MPVEMSQITRITISSTVSLRDIIFSTHIYDNFPFEGWYEKLDWKTTAMTSWEPPSNLSDHQSIIVPRVLERLLIVPTLCRDVICLVRIDRVPKVKCISVSIKQEEIPKCSQFYANLETNFHLYPKQQNNSEI